jgi:iron complex outermembrane receptor protein
MGWAISPNRQLMVRNMRKKSNRLGAMLLGSMNLGAMILAAALVLSLAGGQALAQDSTEALGTVLVTSETDTIERVTQADMERKGGSTLFDALKSEPGVYVGISGGRNEGIVSIRGSSRYQVGLYIDDVPVASAFRNEWDLSNTMLFDLESVEVSKGFSSPLLSSNNGLAGVVNVRTYKPVKELDVMAKYVNNFDRLGRDQGRLYGLRLGTRQPKFYLQAAVVEERRDFFRLPHSFQPGRYEDGGRRDNSDLKNSRLNFIAGWTPTEDVDVMFGYVKQEYEKGQPFEASPPETAFNRNWRWPMYDTERFYLNADVKLTEKAKIKTLLYYDQHEDMSVEYADNTLSAIAARNRDTTYKQYTAGGQVRVDYDFNQANHLAMSIGYRELSHKDIRNTTANPDDGRTLVEHDVEHYLDIGAEYILKPIDDLALAFGLTWTQLTPDKVEQRRNTNAGWSQNFIPLANQSELKNDLLNYQIGIFWDLAEQRQLFTTIAKKGRMATMRERFWRNADGDASANPFLKPEEVWHYEIGYRGLIFNGLETVVSGYWSTYKNKIVQRGISPDTYWVNINNATIYGLDLSLLANLSETISVGSTFSLMKGENKSDNTRLTNMPKLMGSAWAVVKPIEGLRITPQVDFRGSYFTSNNNNTIFYHSNGFLTADIKAAYDINDYLTVEFGAKNIFDALYAYDRFYPEQGRNYYLGLTAKY